MELLEKNRIKLMGIATLSVFIAHIIHRFGAYGTRDFLPCIMLYTYGFLFLSGYSIAYSLNRRNNDLVGFYKKRISNTYIPFLIASLIPITLMCIFERVGITMWLTRLSSFNFFFEGNVCGTWYIAVIMVLYSISPLLYHFRKWATLFLFLVITIMITSRWTFRNLYDYEHAFMFQTPAYIAGFACYQCKSVKIMTITGCSIFVMGIVTRELNFIEMGVSIIMLQVWGWYFLLSNKRYKTIKWLGDNSLLLYLIHLEVCFLLQRNGCNPKASIIIGIIVAIVTCKPIAILCNRVNSFLWKFAVKDVKA